MKDISISKVIVRKRNEKGVTQDDLASFLGVSKASVSKWETEQNYPDILLLPRLASYFNISMDELMGYEPQMTDGQISKLYIELSNEFATKPYAEVLGRCSEIVRKYYSCFPLLLKMGLLYINYGVVLQDGEQRASIISEAKKLFVRVKELSDDIELKQVALNKEAMCELFLGNADGIIDLLKDIKPPPHYKMLLAQAYIMTGKIDGAKMELQESIFHSITEFFETLPPYLLISVDDAERFEEIYNRAIMLIETFNLKGVVPWAVLPFYTGAAQGFAVVNKLEKALDVLEEYTELATGDIYPLKMVKADAFFDLIENIAENLSFGATDLPRDEKVIKQSMADGVLQNPAFQALTDNPRYKILEAKLKNNLK